MTSAPVEQDAPRRSREFAFSEQDFNVLRVLVKEHTGIHLSEEKRELVYGRLSRRLRALGLDTFRQYCDLLSDGNSSELVQFCNAITTNLTSFFREAHHFDYVREHLFAPRIADPHASRRVRIWSAGCSTGEEPYSLAMTIAEAVPDLARWDIRILATDIDSDVLDRGSRGLYDTERLSGVDSARRERFFRKESAGGDSQWAVSPQLRNLITFKQLNLLHALPMKGPLDAIFCRNVIIYFDRDTQCGLFERMARLQRSGAILFLGHSESLFRISDAYTLIGKTIYRRV